MMEIKNGPDRSTIRTSIWYGTVVFVSSACLLVLEIVAGRLLAPYIGVSLYTWTSIIGVILAGMALGNWLGGKLADEYAEDWVVGAVLAGSGISSLGILLVLMIVAPWVQAIVTSLLAASFLFVSLLFFIPAVFLGVITPLVITMNLAISDATGRVIGRLHALAALGSITGTFITGYWLVQWFGTRAIVISTGLVLVAMAVPFLRRRVDSLLVIAGGVVVVTALGVAVKGFVNPCDVESRYYCIRVIEEDIEQIGDTGLSLILDHMTHSTNHRSRPDSLLTPYVQAMDELIHRYFDSSRLRRSAILFAGGGAYTHPRAFRTLYPDAEVTVVELDPEVSAAARERMSVDTSDMTVIHGDVGRVVSTLPSDRYDVVVLDVFHDLAIPYHLATREFFEIVARILAAEGLFLINVVDVFPDPRLAKALIKTLESHFSYVDLWMERPPENEGRLAYVLTAGNSQRFPDRISARKGISRTWYRLTDAVAATGTPMQAIPELTSDYAPVERLLSTLFTTPSGL